MNEELERNENGATEGAEAEETFAPRSKYERIMLAAAEAGRLNEEIRRKGIKLDHKVTIEAVLRVDDGKVRGTIRDYEIEEEPPAPIPEMPASPLFGETGPAPASAAGGGENGGSTKKPAAEDDEVEAEDAAEESEEEADDEDDLEEDVEEEEPKEE